MMDRETVIKVMEITKEFDSVETIAGISFEIYRGEIFALLGPDGAGKTTIVEILEGLRKPTSGHAWILGYDVKNKLALREIKKVIGTLPQEFITFENLTVKENIKYWGKMYDQMVDPRELISLVKLEEKQDELYKNLSSGMKRLVGLAIALVNDPEILILDEPTSGLDLRSRKETWRILEDLRDQGKTVFFTTNHVLEPQAIANRVSIIYEGRIKDIGSPNDLIERYTQGNKVIVRCADSDNKQDAKKVLANLSPKINQEGDLVISGSDLPLLRILETLEKEKIMYTDIITKKPDLNDVFLILTGESLTEEVQE
ncbi:MAG: ATP-binding cassette domain-containing protein [Candidatus Heimdallarchaeota archaeon]|nr:ATP-binding cassette domain-containing protein [Candidatus Heimdallarchaeota archaeon]